MLINLHDVPQRAVELPNGDILSYNRCGEVQLYVTDENGKKRTVRLTEVMYIPEMDINLISVRKLVEKGGDVHFELRDRIQYVQVNHHGKSVIVGELRNSGLYEPTNIITDFVATAENSITINDVHRKLGHVAYSTIRRIDRNDCIPYDFVDEKGI